jgi:hypothetical protein
MVSGLKNEWDGGRRLVVGIVEGELMRLMTD